MAVAYLKRNDLLPTVTGLLVNDDGSIDNFTGATVKFIMRLPGAATATINSAATFTNVAVGAVEYVWASGNTGTAGSYDVEWQVTFPDGSKPKTFPGRGYDRVVIGDDLDTATAASTDLLTIIEARLAARLDIENADDDTQLSRLVRAVSRRLDTACGPIVVRTVIDELDGGRTQLRLRQYPVYAMLSVSEYAHTTATALTAETNTVKGANDFLHDTRGYGNRILRRANGADAVFAAGRRNVVVTYQAGRYANTADVAEHFKEAARLVIAQLHRRKAPNPTGPALAGRGGGAGLGTVPAFALPHAAIELLHDEMLPPGVA